MDWDDYAIPKRDQRRQINWLSDNEGNIVGDVALRCPNMYNLWTLSLKDMARRLLQTER